MLPEYVLKPDEKEDARQAALRASFTRARLNPEERLLSRGAITEQAGQLNHETADRELSALTDAPISERQPMHAFRLAQAKRMSAHGRRQRAEGLAMQGRYREAVSLHPDQEKRDEYLKIIAAIERNDEDGCSCDDVKTESIHTGEEIRVPTSYVVRDIYSEKHKGLVSLIACATCGDMNARALTGRLAEMRAARKRNRAAAHPDSTAGFVTDTHLLKVAKDA